MRDSSSARGPRWLFALVAVLLPVLLVAVPRAYLGIAYDSRIYPGVRVAGVDVGGLTVDQAAATLQAQLGIYQQTPVAIRAGDATLQTTPGEFGFKPDAPGLAKAAYDLGRAGGPLLQLAGPVVASSLASSELANPSFVDDGAVEAAVGKIAAAVDRPSRDAELTLPPQLALRPSQTGQRLDQAGAREALRQYLATHQTDPLTLPVAVDQPRVTTETLAPIKAQVEQILGQPIVLVGGGQQWPIPASVVAGALVLRSDPYALDVKTDPFAGIVKDAASKLDRPARDAALAIAGTKVQLSPEQSGLSVDQAATLAALHDGLLQGRSSVAVVTTSPDAAIKASDLQPVASRAQALIDQGIALSVGDQAYSASSAEVAGMLQIQRDATGAWGVALDQQRVAALVARVNGQYQRPSLDARFGWENGRVKVLQPTVPAVVVDQPKAVASILAKWQSGQVDLPVTAGQMTLDQAYVDRLNADLKGIIQERSISFAGSIPERAQNIGLALSKINGTLVLPGETFSFARAVGPLTLDAGFRWGFAYSSEQGGAKVVPSLAGGICQVSTSVFQPVFWAGYEIVERHWHMFAMRNYAVDGYVGLDATVFPEQGLDFQFKNTTDHALLILAGTRGAATYVGLVGTKPDWTVKVDPEVITDVTPAPTQVVRETSPLFAKGRQITLEVAQGGLTSHVVRHVIYPDGHDRVLKLTSDYQAAPTQILVGAG